MTLTGGWQYITLDIPADATAVAGFSAVGAAALIGAVSIDQMIAHFGTAANDVTPPVVTELYCDGLSFSARVADNYPLPVTQAMITLTLDGAPVPFAYDPETGGVLAQLPSSVPGVHRVTLTVQDYFLNTSRSAAVFGETASMLFEDIANHWSRDAVEYLRLQGVFADDVLFQPQKNVYNEMAAVLIARFLHSDVTQYESLPMPYADAAAINDWAAPSVKAMFYENIMVGGMDAEGNRVFRPQADTTRAQVMTILGRTVPRGYDYPAAPFDDAADIPAWAVDHIDLLYAMGIVAGYGTENVVKPLGTITRAELASLFFKMY
jgi:hypothetical protein